MAAGGGLLAYSVLHFDEVDPELACQVESLPDGDIQATGGAVWLVSGADRTPQALPGALPAARLAAAGSLVALMPYSLPSPVNHFPSVQNSVEIWNAASAGRQANVTPPGAVRDLALNSGMLVLLTVDANGARVIRYDTHGAKLGSTPLAASVQRISLGTAHLAYAVGHRIMELDLATGNLRRLYTAPLPPTRVTIGSGRVFWVAGGHRILSIPA